MRHMINSLVLTLTAVALAMGLVAAPASAHHFTPKVSIYATTTDGMVAVRATAQPFSLVRVLQDGVQVTRNQVKSNGRMNRTFEAGVGTFEVCAQNKPAGTSVFFFPWKTIGCRTVNSK